MAQSNQVLGAAGGTAQQLPVQLVDSGILIKALTTNTTLVYIGNNGGTVSTTTGVPLATGQTLQLDHIGDLSELWLLAVTISEGIAWLATGI